MGLITYFDFAEEDYKYFEEDIKNGRVANYLGAMAQNICERYLKHIISEYYEPDSKEEEQEKRAILRTHSLARLIKFVEKYMNCELNEEAVACMQRIDGFYFSTRYPGEESFSLDEKDMKLCARAVFSCRDEILRFTNDHTTEEIHT